MSLPTLAIEKACYALHYAPFARRATVYQTEKLTVKVTRQYKFCSRDTHETFLLTIGVPNYRERQFIRKCKKVGEPFPVPTVQIDFWPKPRKKKAKAKK